MLIKHNVRVSYAVVRDLSRIGTCSAVRARVDSCIRLLVNPLRPSLSWSHQSQMQHAMRGGSRCFLRAIRPRRPSASRISDDMPDHSAAEQTEAYDLAAATVL